MQVNYQAVGKLVAQKRVREGLSLRAAAVETGISASTLSRVENGKAMEAEQLATLAAWLGVDVGRFTNGYTKNVPATVKAILLADKHLGPDEADALGATFATLYRQMAK